MKEKVDHAAEQAYHACLGGDKEKIKTCTTTLLVLEHQAKAFDAIVPLVKNVQKNVKVIAKSKDVPSEYESELASILYFTKFFSMPAFERVKTQLGFRFGQKYVDRYVLKDKTDNVNEELIEHLEAKIKKGEIKERSKELMKQSDRRAKEESRQIQESNQALVSALTTLPSFSSSTSKKSKKSKEVEEGQ